MDVGGSSLPECINPNNFPAKLWRLVNNPANKAISWDRDGTFIIIDQHLFERQILSPGTVTSDSPDAFKTTNFSSFVRQLNLYGFRKADPAVTDTYHSAGDSGAYHYFHNPNFKRNHPELVASLRRLTVDNKAKIQAGLNVNCRPPSRWQRFSGGSSSLLSATRQESTHPYHSSKAQAMTVHNGTPVPPRYLIRGHGAALSPTVFATDKGIPVSLSHHYAGVASSSNAVHVPQGLLGHANPGNQNCATFNPPNAQYQPGFYSTVCHCYQPNLVAPHMTYSGLQTGLFSPQGYYQIADEVMQTPPSSCLVRVVNPENPGPVLVPSSSNTCNTMLSDNPASSMQANPFCTGPIITSASGNADLVSYGQQEPSVLSVPEQMPEDAIFEVTSDDAKDTKVKGVEVSDALLDTSQAYSSSCKGSTPDV
ncbi:heat shock factor protein 5 isoform X1 [Morone saxatilis]|uniref:heat shock factor protein 5 isoform X1 n=1 Tax=Morone saxatilis TaxID=34816 RepID=UPI0015E206C2|nr:heat shock factor protein 5 isoform X1 [Morone saxatilis]